MSTLLLIDGHSQAYRAFFGVKTPLTTRSGELTTAVFGFARKLLSVLKEYQPDYVAVAFDEGDTWRHAEFPEYKGTRERMPDELRSQISRIEELLAAFNIPTITYSDYEADDILGTLAHKAGEQEIDVLILTGDRDLFQLVTDRVKILYTPGGPNPKTTVYGLEEIEQRYGLTPQKFIDLKALTGDSSDNIPGVPGVGEKTATNLIHHYGSLDNIYQQSPDGLKKFVRGEKTRRSLFEHEEQVRLNKRLVTIVTDLDVEFDAERFLMRNYEQSAVVRLFHALEFTSLVKQLPQSVNVPGDQETTGQMSLFGNGQDAEAESGTPTAQSDYITVHDTDTLTKVVEKLKEAKHISFDVETTSTDAMQAKLVGLGLAWAPGGTAYIPVAHTEGIQLAWAEVLEAVRPFFMDETTPKLAHNGKYDLTVCRQHGLDAAGPLHDTMTMAWVLDPASRQLGLKAQAESELGWQMTELTELIGTGRKQITVDQVEIEKVAPYCADDVDATIQLYELLEPRLREAGMWDLYADLELPILPVLTDMEMAGIQLDVEYLQGMSHQLTQRLSELEKELFELVGHEFNQRSTQQLSKVLFEEMGFPTKGAKKTRSGHYSTAVGELERLTNAKLSEKQQRLLTIIFEQRQLEKLRSTYVDALPTLVNPDTGRVHTSFNQTGAVTGRMSSTNPNLQNIPIRTELGRQIRRAFVAPEGWRLMAADYSQVELRILAHIAQEESLTEAFRADQDIHAVTASRLFDVPIEEVDRSQRGLAKTINFATIYGISAFGLSNRTDMDNTQARRFLDQYFETYPKIQEYIGNTLQMAQEKGFVQTLLGRKRFFPELQNGSLPFNRRQGVERAAMNAPIQGTSADIMKIAMVRLHKRLQEGGYQARMLLQVHDELVLELPEEETSEVAQIVREEMSAAYTLDVPLKVDVEVGLNWYEMEKV